MIASSLSLTCPEARTTPHLVDRRRRISPTCCSSHFANQDSRAANPALCSRLLTDGRNDAQAGGACAEDIAKRLRGTVTSLRRCDDLQRVPSKANNIRGARRARIVRSDQLCFDTVQDDEQAGLGVQHLQWLERVFLVGKADVHEDAVRLQRDDAIRIRRQGDSMRSHRLRQHGLQLRDQPAQELALCALLDLCRALASIAVRDACARTRAF